MKMIIPERVDSTINIFELMKRKIHINIFPLEDY